MRVKKGRVKIPEKPYKGEGESIVSFADGISFLSKAAQNAGLPIKKLVRAEIDPYANQIFKQLYGDYYGDKVTDVGDVERLKDIDLSDNPIIVGGPPCQDFSALNHTGQGIEGAKSGLAKVFAELVSKLPSDKRRMIMEQVKIKDKHRGPLLKLFSDIYGKPVSTKIIDAMDWSPVTRKREWMAEGFENGLTNRSYKDLPKDQHDRDYDYYEQGEHNDDFDPTEILNTEDLEGKTLDDFDLDYKPHAQDKWHAQSKSGWLPAILASAGPLLYNPEGEWKGKHGNTKLIVKANDDGKYIWDPGNEDKWAGRKTKSGEPYVLWGRDSKELDMEPGQPYDARYYRPDEADIISGLHGGATKLDPAKLQEITDKVKDYRTHEFLDPKIVHRYYKSPTAYSLTNKLLKDDQAFKDLPEDKQDLATWYNYTGPLIENHLGIKDGKPDYDTIHNLMRIHMNGNGWQAQAAEYVLRRLFGLGGYDDGGFVNKPHITQAIHRRFL
jgi:site-specific DNA-cytosine methylase